jgi:hypothetical protein
LNPRCPRGESVKIICKFRISNTIIWHHFAKADVVSNSVLSENVNRIAKFLPYQAHLNGMMLLQYKQISLWYGIFLKDLIHPCIIFQMWYCLESVLLYCYLLYGIAYFPMKDHTFSTILLIDGKPLSCNLWFVRRRNLFDICCVVFNVLTCCFLTWIPLGVVVINFGPTNVNLISRNCLWHWMLVPIDLILLR